MGRSASSSWAAVVIAAAVVVHANGKAYLSSPAARHVVQEGAFLSPLKLGTLNGGGPEVEQQLSHSLCGSTNKLEGIKDPQFNLMESSVWAPTEPQMVLTEGGTIDIEVTLEENKFGWFEFRLCRPLDNGEFDVETSQECLNQYVLQFDLEFTRAQYNQNMRPGISSPADLLGSNPIESHLLALCSNNPNAPEGSCCNLGGRCSPEAENRERWVVPNLAEKFGENGESIFEMRFVLPQNVNCKRCTLQMYYHHGDTPEGEYPEGTWNCADITILEAEDEQLDPLVIGGASAAAMFTLGLVFYVFVARPTLNQQSYRRNINDSERKGSSFLINPVEKLKQNVRTEPVPESLVIGTPIVISHVNHLGAVTNGPPVVPTGTGFSPPPSPRIRSPQLPKSPRSPRSPRVNNILAQNGFDDPTHSFSNKAAATARNFLPPSPPRRQRDAHDSLDV